MQVKKFEADAREFYVDPSQSLLMTYETRQSSKGVIRRSIFQIKGDLCGLQ